MATAKTEAAPRGFVTSILPWLAGAAGLLVYLVTLDQWISLLSLGTVARASGWLWLPDLNHPVTLLVLAPFRALPAAWVPLCLNLFTACAAAAVLALLARSAALLPYDLTPEDPLRKDRPVTILTTPTAWMPPLISVMVCGLQLSFWENATSATGAMLNLLLAACVICGLFEFRVHRNQAWLSWCAFLYAAGMTNSWVMVAGFPIFLAAVIWVKGPSRFCKWRFLLRMTFWGLAGLGFYLLPPVIQKFSAPAPLDFGLALKAHLKSQWSALAALRAPEFRVLILSSVLPFLLLVIRWKSHTVQRADDSRFGVFLVKATGHFVHAAFFVASIWIALERAFTPRHLKLGTPMLIYYYLWALVSGYCTGYFLLLGSRRRRRKPLRLPALITYALLGILPVTLIWRNLGQIRMTNGPFVRELAQALQQDLPKGKSVVLSEEPAQLLLLRAELSRHGNGREVLPVDTGSLPLPSYRAFMASRFKARWPDTPAANAAGVAGPMRLVKLVSWFAAREPVVYLHPSSGLFFESFMDRPNGAVHGLVPRPAPAGLSPALPPDVMATNEQIWQQRWTHGLQALARRTRRQPPDAGFWPSFLRTVLRLKNAPNETVTTLGAAYSKSLNYWGVELQRAGRWREAGTWFQRALELNPDNLPAHVNAEYNARWQRGEKSRLAAGAVHREFPNLSGQSDHWAVDLGMGGPVDEPTFLLRTGRVMLESGNNRQAADAFARAAQLAPAWPAPKLWLAESFIHLRDFARALELTDGVRASGLPQNGRALAQWLYCRAAALRGLGRTNDATAAIETFVQKHGTHDEVLVVAAALYAWDAQLDRETGLLDELLKRHPNDPDLLNKKGLAELRGKEYDQAIGTLTAALAANPLDDDALLLRAVARLGAGQLDAARSDYRELLARPGNAPTALFGLGGIAWRERDTNAIMQYYEAYLSNSIPNSLQYRIAADRLKNVAAESAP